MRNEFLSTVGTTVITRDLKVILKFSQLSNRKPFSFCRHSPEVRLTLECRLNDILKSNIGSSLTYLVSKDLNDIIFVWNVWKVPINDVPGLLFECWKCSTLQFVSKISQLQITDQFGELHCFPYLVQNVASPLRLPGPPDTESSGSWFWGSMTGSIRSRSMSISPDLMCFLEWLR